MTSQQQELYISPADDGFVTIPPNMSGIGEPAGETRQFIILSNVHHPPNSAPPIVSLPAQLPPPSQPITSGFTPGNGEPAPSLEVFYKL